MGPLSFPSPTDTLPIVLTTRSGLVILQNGSLQLAIPLPLEAISQTSSRLRLSHMRLSSHRCLFYSKSSHWKGTHVDIWGPCELWATRHNVAAPLDFALPVLQTSSDLRANLCVFTRGPRSISIDHLKSNPHGGPHRGITAVTGERKLKSFLSETRASETGGASEGDGCLR